MSSKPLIDAVVQQTTVLIAQLATAAGLRTSLAHVGDQVFVELARRLEQQGVGRKVVADMFGMTLRAYQKKVQRLAEAPGENRSLWEAVYRFLQERGTCSRRQILERFGCEDAMAVGAVLNDLVSSGLVYATGRGDAAIFGLTTKTDRARLDHESKLELVRMLAWMSLDREKCHVAKLVDALPFDAALVEAAVAQLVAEGVVTREPSGLLTASQFVIPVDANQGWGAAVFDHLRTVSAAIAAKVANPKARASDIVGGFTMSLDLSPHHPFWTEATQLLAETRSRVTDLFERAAAYNRANPLAEDDKRKLWFYCGQYLDEGGTSNGAGQAQDDRDDG